LDNQIKHQQGPWPLALCNARYRIFTRRGSTVVGVGEFVADTDGVAVTDGDIVPVMDGVDDSVGEELGEAEAEGVPVAVWDGEDVPVVVGEGVVLAEEV
jgi:hypothetical protein